MVMTMKNKSRKNERNPLKEKREYSYVIDSFGGLDLLSPDGKSADSRFPYLVNMYRDRRKGSGIETFPGYRALPKQLGDGAERVYGLYAHTFEGKDYLLVHKGGGLYIFSAEARDCEERLSPLIALAERESTGFSYGGVFYLLDGESCIRVTSPTEATVLGDREWTEEMKEAGLYPETAAYIPTAFENGAAREPLSLLTDYYDLKHTLTPDTPTDRGHGLLLGHTTYLGEEALEVYGFEKGRKLAFVPETGEYQGKELPIRIIAPGAFSGSEIETVVLSPAVKLIDGIEETNLGAFYSCKSLKTAILYGVETVGADAFALCPALEKVVFGADATLHATAFYGCTALHSVFTPKVFEGVSAYFGEDVAKHTDTLVAYGKVGETLRFPCMNDVYARIYTLYGGEFEALEGFHSYVGVYDAATVSNEGYTVRTLRSAPLVECYMQHSAGEDFSRYVFITVTESDGLLSYRDRTVSYTIPLPGLAEALTSVTLDGKPLRTAYSEGGYYTLMGEAEGDRTYVKGIRISLPSAFLGERVVSIRALGKEKSYGRDTVFDGYPKYSGSAAGLIAGCRKAAVYDGRIFLSGNPQMPRAIFYSVAAEDGSVYFSPEAYLLLPEDGVADLLAHPSYLAVFLTGGGVRFLTPSGGGYRIAGGFHTERSRGKSLLFGDDPVFLSARGLYGIGEGKVWEESRLGCRSALVSSAFPNEGEPALAEWTGYLAILIDGEIFLADGEAPFTYKGEKQYEFYRLEGLGHYRDDVLCYHHLSCMPLVDPAVDGVALSVLGDEREFTGEVLTGVTGGGVTVAYGYLDGTAYLLDTDGERVGGIFYPATHLLSLGDCLYFASSDGTVSVVNTDKRGISPTVGGKALPVGEGEIHSYYYTFDSHRYPSGFATSYADMGVPHLTKSTVKKSVVLRASCRGGSGFTVYVRCDGGVFEKLADLTAAPLTEFDFTRFSFTLERGRTLPVYEGKKGWVDKQYLILSRGFRSPFAMDSMGYRYTLYARPKG